MRDVLSDESVRGIELALTPVVFGVFGWLVDRWAGTGALFTIGLAAFALVGTIAKIWYVYDAEMRQLESTSRWARRAASGPGTGIDPAVAVDPWTQRKVTGT